MKSAAEPIVETRNIATRDGVMTIEMTQSFIDRVRSQFDIDTATSPSDEHLKMYVWGAVNNAINKATQ